MKAVWLRVALFAAFAVCLVAAEQANAGLFSTRRARPAIAPYFPSEYPWGYFGAQPRTGQLRGSDSGYHPMHYRQYQFQ